ncbi:MAG: methionine gamma-lyase [Eubacteriales bacterium]|jgi:methionine-gamma-lyase|nr:methionine gamma-lyase [Eubacteriales bacterium]
MKIDKKLGFATRAVHAGQEPDPQYGALSTPIYQTSTFVFKDVAQGAARFAGEEEGYIYTRLGNPTVTALEEKIACLEGGEDAAAFGSGMAAVSAAIMALVNQGDHVVHSAALYGCTFAFLHELIARFGVTATGVDTADLEAVKKAIRPNTKVVYIESPTNPTMRITDIQAVAEIAHAHGAKVVVDNTFMTPYLQRPLEMGADVVLHSATKYINGHGDVVAGLVISDKETMTKIKMTTLKDIGGIMSPFDAWLILRGLKTLPLRMDRHNSNAMAIAKYLEKHPAVAKVYYPGLESFDQHALAKKQMSGFGGIMSFELKGGFEAGVRLMNGVKICHLAVSLGDIDTLIQHPASMTHSVVPEAERLAVNITPGLVRLAVGLEDVEDIIADLEQAL